MGEVITKRDNVLGITYWVQWDFHKKPNYEIWIYTGTQAVSGALVFRNRRNPSLLMFKHITQLNLGGFVPFLIDIKKVDEYCKSMGWEGPLS